MQIVTIYAERLYERLHSNNFCGSILRFQWRHDTTCMYLLKKELVYCFSVRLLYRISVVLYNRGNCLYKKLDWVCCTLILYTRVCHKVFHSFPRCFGPDVSNLYKKLCQKLPSSCINITVYIANWICLLINLRFVIFDRCSVYPTFARVSNSL